MLLFINIVVCKLLSAYERTIVIEMFSFAICFLTNVCHQILPNVANAKVPNAAWYAVSIALRGNIQCPKIQTLKVVSEILRHRNICRNPILPSHWLEHVVVVWGSCRFTAVCGCFSETTQTLIGLQWPPVLPLSFVTFRIIYRWERQPSDSHAGQGRVDMMTVRC